MSQPAGLIAICCYYIVLSLALKPNITNNKNPT